MKKLGFLFLVFLVMGCSPAYRYNSKMAQLNDFYGSLENASMTGVQKERAYWMEVKKEFPEYADDTYGLFKKLKIIQAKIDSGQDIEQDLNEYDEMRDQFWRDVRKNVRRQDEFFSESLRRSSTHCTTQFFGSTAFTNCY